MTLECTRVVVFFKGVVDLEIEALFNSTCGFSLSGVIERGVVLENGVVLE